MEYCIICGAPLSEGNNTCIGVECRASIKAAKLHKLYAREDFTLAYNWVILADVVKKAFIEAFSNTKFRSAFKKAFYESMLNTNRVSKKQLEVMETELDYKRMLDNTLRIAKEAKDAYMEQELQNVNVTREEIEIARSYIRKNKKL